MRLSTKSRYAARAVLEVAMNDETPIILREIARIQEIPTRYLEQLMSLLVNAGIITSRRGKGGGFSLARQASKIKLSQIVEAVEGPIKTVDCVDNPNLCERGDICVTRDIWEELQHQIRNFLENITLETMISRYHQKINTSGQEGK